VTQRRGGGEADNKRQKRAPPDAATIVLLRAEATTYGAPPTLPDQYLSTWLKYVKSPAPELVRTPDGIFLKSSGSTDEANYYVYFRPVWHDGAFMLQCCSRGCGIRVSWVTKKNGAYSTVFSNPMRHLKTCPGIPLLTHQDWLQSKKTPTAAFSASASASASAPSGAGAGARGHRRGG